jgi:cell division protein FtsL
MLTVTRINIVLIVAIILLSFSSMIWHKQSRLLYQQTKFLAQETLAIMAQKKQLLIEYSHQISGEQITEKAFKILQRPSRIRHLDLR